jgi:hypothetical protein
MSQALRIFVNDKRISTAVIMKNGDFLQVYPEKKTFANEGSWLNSWNHMRYPKVLVESEGSKAPPHSKVSVSSKNWSYKETYRYTAPPGQYYIGDLCYVLSDEIYHKVFGVETYEPGLYIQKDTTNFFLVDCTAYGDGCYMGSDQREFCVDAGIIGITPVSCMAKNDGGGQIYTFKDPVECRFKDGRFSFISGDTHLIIDTGGDGDEY